MALIVCPDCQASVSSIALACPTCGRPVSAGATPSKDSGSTEGYTPSGSRVIVDVVGLTKHQREQELQKLTARLATRGWAFVSYEDAFAGGKAEFTAPSSDRFGRLSLRVTQLTPAIVAIALIAGGVSYLLIDGGGENRAGAYLCKAGEDGATLEDMGHEGACMLSHEAARQLLYGEDPPPPPKGIIEAQLRLDKEREAAYCRDVPPRAKLRIVYGNGNPEVTMIDPPGYHGHFDDGENEVTDCVKEEINGASP